MGLVIALDGHSSSGKSTLAKDLSKALELPHVDSGAMYRAVTLHCLNNDIDPQDHNAVMSALDDIKIAFEIKEGQSHILLNGSDVSKGIRQMSVSQQVSHIATISEVRRFLVAIQRSMKESGGLIMDGRDIGTVVFPDADVKLFVTARLDVRAQRRYDELLERGDKVNYDDVATNLQERDRIDSTRADSPLKRAEDAYDIDTSDTDRTGMLQLAITKIFQSIKGRA